MPYEEVAAKLSDWDGEPRSIMDEPSYLYLMGYLPHYTGLIAGPHPFGAPEGVRTSMLCHIILTPTFEEAEGVLWNQARKLCDDANHPWDEDEWEIMWLHPVNTC
jgi:hypothetical protein